MRTSGKFLAGGVLTVALLVPATTAFATSTYIGYNVNMPAAQQGVLAANQTKSTAGAAGNIRVTSVGADYTVNARQCRLDRAASTTPYVVTCGTERKGLGEGSSSTLPSGGHVSAGKTAWLELHNSRWTGVRVTAIGTWRAN